MSPSPPDIPSKGDNPTEFGRAPRPAKGPGRIESQGDSPTNWQEAQLARFVTDGAEIPPEMVDEHKGVLLKPGDVVADRFEVVAMLGFGGMGAVYHVKDRHLRTEKALKVMLPALLKSGAARERFRSEVAISQQLRHDNVVTVYDLMADRARGFYFFTMEYVPGKTLHRVLAERGGPLPLGQALDIARQLCD
ncbi:MAG: protein kinase, partial [Candidatus Hydrogenedentes bacterium]|nr:protein kinase [Candidatus Hydrogenedentota bacterium]